ncbi:MinD/ParA family protein [Mesoterricola silvestris]|uniref:Site-determining protein n=1 Tax=Mesoterricola silvestris TaxID=2927979 RepID=A0AA48GPX2_9BACT|nr:MinD/ParA family protein [Mesoterricola silvestris]BDU73540.1 site-determining protein [Mesoterricola silvestris]
MNDQANRLRALSRNQPAPNTLFGSRVMAIASGKGGVGKTNVVAGLAMSLAQMGQRVVVLDADFGLANLDILLGMSPQWTLEHVLRGEKLLEEILLDGPFGIRIIPASSGIQELTRLDAAAELRLVQGLQRVSQGIDWLLIDTAAGIHDSVIKLLMAAQEVLLVTTPEPTALVDAYAMVKTVHLRDPHKPLWLLVNNAQNGEEAEETIEQLQAATRRFLSRDLQVLGMVPTDPFMLQAVRQQRCVADLYPQAPSAQAFLAAAQQLQQKIPLQKEGFAAFWKGLSVEEP